MNTRPAAIVGCVFAETPAGKPKAHFSFNRGTCAAVRPAACAGWNRELDISAPQPFHAAPRAGSERAGLLRHLFGMFLASPCWALPTQAVTPIKKVVAIARLYRFFFMETP